MRVRIITGVVLAIFLIAAMFFPNAWITGRTTSWSEAHVKTQPTSDTSYLVARTYSQLTDRLLTLIQAGAETGLIRLYNYTSDAKADLARAQKDILSSTPLGAFAVYDLKLTGTQVLSYYDVSVSISYSRPPEVLASIHQADSAEKFSAALSDAIKNSKTELLVMVEYYSEELINIPHLLSQLKLTHPDVCYGFEGYKLTLYPDHGLHRLLALSFTYNATPGELARQRALAESALSTLISRTAWLSGESQLRLFRDELLRLAALREPRESTEDDTPYGLLVGGHGSAFGFASTFSILCERAQIPCALVVGTYRGAPRIWNMVRLNDTWYHIDLAAENQNPAAYTYFLKTGAQMIGYDWNMSDAVFMN